MKTLLLVLGIAGATVWGVLALKPSIDVDQDLSALSRQLRDPDPRQRQAAATELGSRGGTPALLTLACAVREDSPSVRAILDNALREPRDPKARQWLVASGLDSPDRWVRYYAVRAVRVEKKAEAAAVLLPRLKDNFWQVQIAILEAVEAQRPPEAVPVLGGLLHETMHWQVRAEAMRLLGEHNSPAAVEQLLNAIPAEGQADPHAGNALEAALGGMTAEPALSALAAQVDAASEHRKLAAIRALGRARHAGSAAKLRAISADAGASKDLRIAALRAAIAAGGEEGLGAGMDRLSDADAVLRLEAAYALSEAALPPDRIREIEALAAKETDWRVKQAMKIAARPR
jgi:HEAT repeat protein